MDATAFRTAKLPMLSLKEARRRRRAIFAAIGTNIDTFIGVMDRLPGINLTIKTIEGYYIYKNTSAVEAANLGKEKDILGKRAQDIYPSKNWHFYVDQEAAVLESGKPYVNRVSGFSSDFSSHLNSKSVFPLKDKNGNIIALLTMFRRIRSDRQTPGWNDQMQACITYINEHLSDNLTVRRIARQAGLSETRFSRLFTALTDDTPSRYIAKMRVNAAKVLLETTDRLLPEIAEETGFFDASHFSRVFKKITGLTPARYRKQHWAI